MMPSSPAMCPSIEEIRSKSVLLCAQRMCISVFVFALGLGLLVGNVGLQPGDRVHIDFPPATH